MKKTLHYTLSYTNIYNKFFPLIYSVVFNKIKNSDDTSDICQEIFTRFYLKFSKIENHRNWLYRAMQLVLFEYYKKKKKKRIECGINDKNLEYNENSDTKLMTAEILKKLDKFGNRNGKIVFEMIAIQKMSFKNTAHELGITARQTQYQYNAVISYLQDFIKNKGISSLEELL